MASRVSRRRSSAVSTASAPATVASPFGSSSADKDDGFVSGENFDFKFKSPKGVMTRARRSSIYGGRIPSATSKLAVGSRRASAMPAINETKPVPAPAKPARKSLAPQKAAYKPKEPSTAAVVPPARGRARGRPRKTPVKVTAAVAAKPEDKKRPSATNSAQKQKPKKRNSSELDKSLFKDVEVVLERLRHTPAKAVDANEVFDRLELVKRSPVRVQLVCDDIIKEINQQQPAKNKTPENKGLNAASKRTTRSTKKRALPPPSPEKRVLAPAPERAPLSPKKNVAAAPSTADMNRAPSSFLGTPQSANPMALLKNTMKHKVKQVLEEKLAHMPTSPYALLEGETETGSPEYAFTKVKAAPPASAKRKGSAIKLPAAAKYLGATPGMPERRPALSPLGVNAEQEPNSPKLNRSVARKLDLTDVDEEEDVENRQPASPVFSPKRRRTEALGPESQLVTGSLANACSIM